MSTHHPKSICGRLEAGKRHWLSISGVDTFLFLDAAAEIERLTSKLTETRRNLRQANRVLEAKSAIRTRDAGKVLANDQSVRRMALDLEKWFAQSGMGPEQQVDFHAHWEKVKADVEAAMKKMWEHSKRAAESVQGPSPAPETPPEPEKAPQRSEMSQTEHPGGMTIAEVLDHLDQKHVTTP